MVTLWLTALVALLLAYFWFRARKVFSFWSSRGIPGPPPVFPLGNTLPILFGRLNMGEFYRNLYEEYKSTPLVGVYDTWNPMLVVNEPELVGRMLVKDFAHFVDHGFSSEEHLNPTDHNLFNLTGNKWRALRNKMTPTFTTGKLKGMTGLMLESANSTLDFMESSGLKDVDLKDIMGFYATKVIGSCVFGIDASKLGHPDSEFRKMGRRMFVFNFTAFIKFLIIGTIPWLARKLRLSVMPHDVTDYFLGIVRQTLDQRRKEVKSRRQDFVQMLLELRDKGSVELHTTALVDPEDEYLFKDQQVVEQDLVESFKMTDDLILSQALTFLTSGFEGISLVMMYTAYQLSINPDCQERARKEVMEVKAKHGGEYTYQSIKEMTYLDQCVNECLRLHPLAWILFRFCTKDYVFPDGTFIEKGQAVLVPVYGFHMDPQYFPDPDKFIPERFDSSVSTPIPFSYLPFGEGPRMCIGMRFALFEIKLGLAALLENWKFTLSSKTKLPLEYSARDFMMTPKNPVLFNMSKVAKAST